MKNLLLLLLISPLLLVSQNFEGSWNGFVNDNGSYHKGFILKFKYAYVQVYSGNNWKTDDEKWVGRSFSCYPDYVFDGKGDKYFWEKNSDLSGDGQLVFDLENGERIVINFNKLTLILYTKVNSDNEYTVRFIHSKGEFKWQDE